MAKYDIIVYGATGQTGKATAIYFKECASKEGLTFAIAGRSEKKVKEVAAEIGHGEFVIADSGDASAVEAMVKQCKVIVTTVGPFRKYGENIVASCAKNGVHYCDITGETAFVRDMIDKYEEDAKKSGARIVPFCGFDSCPSDLGTRVILEHALAEYNEKVKSVTATFAVTGGLNGGTLASAIEMAENGDFKNITAPFYLNPNPALETTERLPDQMLPRYKQDISTWTAPFFMHLTNSRVVRRSIALLKDRFASPTYEESMGFLPLLKMTKLTPCSAEEAPEPFLQIGFVPSLFVSIVMIVGPVFMATSFGRDLMKKLGPAPGEGPSDESKANAFFRTVLVGTTESDRKIYASVQAQGDPSNVSTVRFLAQCAITALKDGDKLEKLAAEGKVIRSGILTPSSAYGELILERLNKNGCDILVHKKAPVPSYDLSFVLLWFCALGLLFMAFLF